MNQMTETDNPKQRLLQAAAWIFAEQGFDKASVREICQHAQTNVAAINYYFGDKANLYREIFLQPIPWLQEPFDLDNDGNPLTLNDALRKFFQQLLRPCLQCNPTDPFSIMLRLHARELLQPTGILLERAKIIEPHHDRICQFLAHQTQLPKQSHTIKILAISLVGMAKIFWVDKGLVQYLEPDLMHDHDAIEKLANRLASQALTLINAELTTGQHNESL